jgi:peptidoglycan biosynthesis protein MviN/MurJ (putative lipid II flippase)
LARSDGRDGKLIPSLVARFSAVHVNHKRIASGAALIGVLLIVAKLFVAGREVAIAWRFGVSGLVDAYQLSLTIVTWLPMMLTNVMTVVLVPRLVQLQSRPEEQKLFLAELNGSVIAIGILLAAGVWLAAPAAAALLGSRAEPTTLQLTASISRQIAPVALFMIVTGYLSARLQSNERFAYCVSEAIPAAMIALLVLAPVAISSESRLVSGAVFGYAMQVAVLGTMLRRGDRSVALVRLRHRSAEWPSIYRALLVMAAGQLILTATLPIDQLFASRLGEGAVATLGYANRIITLVTSFGVVVLARALLPVLSEAAAAGNHTLGSRQARQWSWLLFGTGLVVGAVGALAAPAFVSLLFQRGAFSADDTEAVAELLQFGMLQLPFYFAGVALVQWVAATSRYGALLVVACGALVVKILGNLFLVQPLGLEGLMVATAAMYALSFVLQYIFVARTA